MNLRQRTKKVYKNGIRWATDYPSNELIIHVGYIATVIAELCFLWRTSKIANIYTYMMFFHIVSMYVLGYLKDRFEYAYIFTKRYYIKRMYAKVYFALNGIILGVTMASTKSVIALVLLLVPIGGSVFIIAISQVVITIFEKIAGTKKYSLNNKAMYTYTFYTITIMVITYEVSGLSILVLFKIILVLAYILCIPIIAVGVEKRMSFVDFIMR